MLYQVEKVLTLKLIQSELISMGVHIAIPSRNELVAQIATEEGVTCWERFGTCPHMCWICGIRFVAFTLSLMVLSFAYLEDNRFVLVISFATIVFAVVFPFGWIGRLRNMSRAIEHVRHGDERLVCIINIVENMADRNFRSCIHDLYRANTDDARQRRYHIEQVQYDFFVRLDELRVRLERVIDLRSLLFAGDDVAIETSNQLSEIEHDLRELVETTNEALRQNEEGEHSD